MIPKFVQAIIFILAFGLFFSVYYYNMQLDYRDEVIRAVNGSLQECIEANSEWESSYEDLFYSINSVVQQIEAFEAGINDSMEWFNENANIDNVSLKSDFFQCADEWCYEALKFYLEDKCYEPTPTGLCEMKLGCIEMVNSNYVSLEYIPDLTSSGKDDKLFGLSDFVANGGGDCEDYALFYKAEVNYILDECYETNFISWIPTENYDDYITLEFLPDDYYGSYWIRRYSENFNIPIAYRYPNVVCGNLYDFNEDKVSGHCMIAFTTQKIKSINDIELLEGAYIVEPQTGMYMGRVRQYGSDDYADDAALDYAPMIFLQDKDLPDSESFISQVITDKDLYMYTLEKDWISYGSLRDDIAVSKQMLVSLQE